MFLEKIKLQSTGSFPIRKIGIFLLGVGGLGFIDLRKSPRVFWSSLLFQEKLVTRLDPKQVADIQLFNDNTVQCSL